MKLFRLSEIPDARRGHFLGGILSGRSIHHGSMSYKKPGAVTHTEGRHVHDDDEVFVILQGTGEMEIDGVRHPIGVGDVVVAEAGEDHHLRSSADDPVINLWFHLADEPNPEQKAD